MVNNVIETDDGQPGNLDQLTKDLQEAVNASAPANPQDKQTPDPVADVKLEGDNVPVKLRGKSLTEVVGIYTQLESQYGRMANDLGQQRVLTDRLLNLKRDSDLTQNGGSKAVELPTLKSTDLLEDPTAAIDKVVEARLKQEREQQQQQNAASAAQLAAQRFVTAHPDYESYVNDAGFVEWVNSSPTRKRAASMAANGDYETASDILTEYKEVKASKNTTVEEEAKKNLEKARAAGLETSGASAAAAGTKTGKVYRRSDLLRLQMEKPDVYYNDDFQREIIKAYNEKRVK